LGQSGQLRLSDPVRLRGRLVRSGQSGQLRLSDPVRLRGRLVR
jgi:hypothetical protein